MTLRFRLTLALASATIALFAPGCNDAFNAGPIGYADNLQTYASNDQAPKVTPKARPVLRKALAEVFGDDPQHIKVPAGSGLVNGGALLANRVQKDADKFAHIGYSETDPATGQSTGVFGQWQEGGYSLYRKHCLHCHGVAGGGDGPTSSFLYPRPRDYRPGVFKFTTTAAGQKPSRDDLRKTLLYGLHGTSMPAFEALMTPRQIEQVIDYLIFLSARGETELGLAIEINSADPAEVEKPEFQSTFNTTAAEIAQAVFKKWSDAPAQVVQAMTPRVPSTRESILRGRDLFVGQNKTGNKVECAGCHGIQAKGNGKSFIDEDLFKQVTFGGNPSDLGARIDALDPKAKEAWKGSLDEWLNPLRPNNLNLGVYKGGRRPIDIYQRIVKGINGAKMPAHSPGIGSDQIWDLVNFVLVLPFEPELLRYARLPETPAAAPTMASNPTH